MDTGQAREKQPFRADQPLVRSRALKVLPVKSAKMTRAEARLTAMLFPLALLDAEPFGPIVPAGTGL